MSSDQDWSTASVHRQTSPWFQRLCHRLFCSQCLRRKLAEESAVRCSEAAELLRTLFNQYIADRRRFGVRCPERTMNLRSESSVVIALDKEGSR